MTPLLLLVGTIPVFNRDDSLPSGRVRNKKNTRLFLPSAIVGLWSGRSRSSTGTTPCHPDVSAIKKTLGSSCRVPLLDYGRDDPGLQPGRLLAIRTCPQ